MKPRHLVVLLALVAALCAWIAWSARPPTDALVGRDPATLRDANRVGEPTDDAATTGSALRAEGRPAGVAAKPAVPTAGEPPTNDPRVGKRRTPSIEGVVRDAASGAPIAGVDVVARPALSGAAGEPLALVSDASGRFRLPPTATGAWDLEFGEGHVAGPLRASHDFVRTVVRGVEAGESDLAVALERGLSIEGVVLDDAGDPLARAASVDAIRRAADGESDWTARRIVRLAPGGALRVPGLAAGTYDLFVVPDAEEADAKGSALSATVVRGVVAGTHALVVRLARGRTLTGRIADAHGEPVLGAGAVHAWRAGDGRRDGVPLTAAVKGDGTFRVGPLEETTRYDLVASGFARSRETRLAGVSPTDADVVLVLEGADRIAGRVVGPHDVPVGAGVPVGAASDALAPGDTTRRFTTTLADGSFALEGIAEGVYQVEAGGGASGWLGKSVADVRSGATEVVLTVTEGVSLAGTLVDDAGAPVTATSLQADDGARIGAMRPYAQVGSDGKFLLRGLRAGRVRLAVMRAGTFSEIGDTVAPAKDVRVVVRSP